MNKLSNQYTHQNEPLKPCQVRRLVASVVLANASDALLDGRCFRQTLKVVSELWRGFRSHCKVELAVLLEGFLLRTLRASSPQVRCFFLCPCFFPPLVKASKEAYEYVNVYTKGSFLCTSATFSFPARGLFSCSRLRGTQGARLPATRKFGPRPGSVTCALGVQSRGELALFAGSLSARAKQEVHGNPTVLKQTKKKHTIVSLYCCF